jgi:phospholipase C
LWNLPSAADNLKRFLKQAIKYGQKANLPNSMFYLGAAVHLLQDICVPHHSCNFLFHGHAEYEGWVKAHLNEYPLIPIYEEPLSNENMLDIFLNNAAKSCDYIELVTEKASMQEYRTATQILLPLAQYGSAKMFIWAANNLIWKAKPVCFKSMAL